MISNWQSGDQALRRLTATLEGATIGSSAAAISVTGTDFNSAEARHQRLEPFQLAIIPSAPLTWAGWRNSMA
jgi:hypothetical protein